nr:MAG TPA: delta-sleep-inducing peptide [Caudoviricetes sp.]
MKYDKQAEIEGLKRTIEQTEARIVELSEPCVKSLAFSRPEERDLLKKKVKGWKKRIKELEDENR